MGRYRYILPLILGFCCVAGHPAAGAGQGLVKKISWTSSDGVILVGLFRPPRQPQGLVWILLHGLGSVKEEWLDFTRQLGDRGEGYLIYDARGHGESVRRSRGGSIDYRDFRNIGPGSEWERMVGDLSSAVSLLEKRFLINPQRIAVGGASLGANVALAYAGRHQKASALILLSPGLEYAGIQSEEAFRRYGTRPLFLAASQEDSYAYASLRRLIALRTDPNCTVAQGEGAQHGVKMLTESFTKRLLGWIKAMEDKQ